MHYSGQVSMEVIIGVFIFLVFFIAVASFSFSQTNTLENQRISLEEEKDCLGLSQILTMTKTKNITWQGELDNNFYIKDATLLVNYLGVAFSGTFCKTINTQTEISLPKGTWRISYQNGYTFEAIS